MRESIFRFKQFSVRNEKSAMKVGTDGVLIGAWCDVDNVNSVLDIGCGTGLISLMVAQRQPLAQIDAVEIDDDACNEALVNFRNSPWTNRLSVISADFKEFAAMCSKRYDLIVSNPPFFTNGVLPPNESRKNARHCASLSFADLLAGASRLLSERGRICVITPCESDESIRLIADDCGLKNRAKTIVYPKPASQPKRILWQFDKNADRGSAVIDSLIIETEERHHYSNEYISLTKDFYLKM